MPKLSHYVHSEEKTGNEAQLDAAAAAQLSALQLHHPHSNKEALHAGPALQTPAAAAGEQHPASTRLKEAFDRRLREHGPRLFRWPDGSLRPSAPAPSPAAAANRRKWAPLVLHCRTHGGERAYQASGRSLRYGINVSAAEHAAYLQQAGLVPEGSVEAAAQLEVHPLEDPQHALNSYYKDAAAEVFKGARGRLL